MSKIIIAIEDVPGKGVEQRIAITDNDGHHSPAVQYAYRLLAEGDRIMEGASYDHVPPPITAEDFLPGAV